MNANELADELDKCMEDGSTDLVCVEQAATMLRQQQEKLTKYELRHVAQRDRIAILEMQHKQQQAEIEALKKEAALQRLSDFTQEADNEPVAWMHQNPEYPISKHRSQEYNIPLYTHPASLVDWSYQQGYQVGKETHLAKTLTDEEIEDFTVRIYNCRTGAEAHEIVLAILRKAQDK